MSKYRISSAWPVGAWVLPGGMVINNDGDPNAMDYWSLELWRRNIPPPLDAQPLTQATYREMVNLYGENRVAPVRGEQ